MSTPQMSGDRYRVFTLRHGTRDTTRSHVFLDYTSYGEPDGPHTVDYFFWVLQNESRVIVVDTGYDAEVAQRRGRVVLHDPIEMLRDHLGIEAEDVDTVVVTHCHYDHIGNLSRFPRATVHLAAAELDFVRSGALRRGLIGHFTEPAEVDDLNRLQSENRLVTVVGAEQLASGVRLVPVGGHTPGQLMVEVDTAAGPVLLTSDALHFDEEIDRDMPFISSMDLPATYRAFDEIRSRADAGSIIVAGHDPSVLTRMTAVTDDIGVIG